MSTVPHRRERPDIDLLRILARIAAEGSNRFMRKSRHVTAILRNLVWVTFVLATRSSVKAQDES